MVTRHQSYYWPVTWPGIGIIRLTSSSHRNQLARNYWITDNRMKLIPIILVLSVILVNFQAESFTKGLITKVRNKLKNTVEAKRRFFTSLLDYKNYKKTTEDECETEVEVCKMEEKCDPKAELNCSKSTDELQNKCRVIMRRKCSQVPVCSKELVKC